MTSIEITDLGAIPAIDDADVLPIQDVSSGTTYKVTRATLSPLKSATVSLTSAQIKDLQSTPKLLVAAQGTGTIVQPVMVTFKLTYGTTPYTITGGANLLVGLGFKTLATISQTFLTVSVDEYAVAIPASYNGGQSGLANTAVYLYSSTTPPAAGDGTLSVTTWYVVA